VPTGTTLKLGAAAAVTGSGTLETSVGTIVAPTAGVPLLGTAKIVVKHGGKFEYDGGTTDKIIADTGTAAFVTAASAVITIQNTTAGGVKFTLAGNATGTGQSGTTPFGIKGMTFQVGDGTTASKLTVKNSATLQVGTGATLVLAGGTQVGTLDFAGTSAILKNSGTIKIEDGGVVDITGITPGTNHVYDDDNGTGTITDETGGASPTNVMKALLESVV